ncbi:MAG TPA: PspC domain-containing protein [Anaerolineales bacterium]|nr:PspC domain-containing protein [Anaerolineales bacterium]
MQPRLYRSRTDVMLGGVCGGLGAYLGLDPTLIRLFFVVLALGTGIGVFLYLLLWIVVPVEGAPQRSVEESAQAAAGEMADRARTLGQEFAGAVARPNPRMGIFVGVALVAVGLIWMIQNLDLPWLRWLDFDFLWPTLLIIGGIVLILRRLRGE